ncbi:hypothetical protein KGM_202880 [Danaus plexippus plexippus]|uniref:Uncharacterized protein n=1 Tax=Danaus plexippus plexippus TaxID=278856 RepID=A0A212F3V5_DANPL|nr:hypothetical protein KGM_202880 [Danaus plexippus plexippus]
MASPDSIHFDETPVNTQLAEEYLKTKLEIHPRGYGENGSYEMNAFNNKIFFSDIDTEPDKLENKEKTASNLSALYKLIKTNANLFCQLEYLIRGVPVKDVERYDLKLIFNNLLYCNQEKKNFVIYNDVYCDKLAFLSDTPLAVLGFVGQSLLCHLLNKTKIITIICDKHTAVIGSLFVDLCHEVGILQVKLLIVPDDTDCSKYDLLKVSELSSGCVGVVSNRSDVDSAVDTFLSSSTWYPWRIKKVFIQESALKRFTSAMKWKTRGRASDVTSCEISFSREEKLFVLEPGSVRDDSHQLIVLEAYRTVKELLNLLQNEKPFAISLWCSDLAETNEISHHVDSNIVWVNDHANFQGPPQSSQAFYSVIDLFYSSLTIPHVPELDQIKKLRESWLRRSPEQREAVLMEESRKHTFFTTIILEKHFQDNYVRVTKSNVIMGTIVPGGVWLVDFCNKLVDMSVINFVMKGGGLLVNYMSDEIDTFFKNLNETFEVPVVYKEEEAQSDGRKANVLWKPCYKHKVIWTNYGTIFAN